MNDDYQKFFGVASGDYSRGQITCDFCGTVYNKGIVNDGNSVYFEIFAGKAVCSCCYRQIEEGVLRWMPQILPWYEGITKKRKENVEKAENLLMAEQARCEMEPIKIIEEREIFGEKTTSVFTLDDKELLYLCDRLGDKDCIITTPEYGYSDASELSIAKIMGCIRNAVYNNRNPQIRIFRLGVDFVKNAISHCAEGGEIRYRREFGSEWKCARIDSIIELIKLIGDYEILLVNNGEGEAEK